MSNIGLCRGNGEKLHLLPVDKLGTSGFGIVYGSGVGHWK